MSNTKPNAFAKYTWFVLSINILVILWGAFVRATGSGAGCGSHWPLCNGEVLPRAPELETLIEFGHRLSSGALGFLVLGLVIWAFRAYERNHPVRKAAIWTGVFVVTEALIGAGLVKFEWVAANVSIERVYSMAFHLVNTFFLLAANVLTAWFASGGRPFRLRGQGLAGGMLIAALLGTLVLGTSGAITALGDTLHLTAGVSPTESPLVASLLELRIYHPLIAFFVFGLVVLAAQLAARRHPESPTPQLAIVTIALFVVQLLCGGLNVYLKAPVWMQLVHLLLSDLIWIALILLTAAALAEQPRSAEEQTDVPAPVMDKQSAVGT